MFLKFIIFFLALLAVVSSARALNITQTKPGCQSKCGNVNIPYPFGIGVNCSLGEWSNVHCNTTFNPPRPFIYKTLEVLKISTAEIRTRTLIAFACYNESGAEVNNTNFSWNFTGTPYTFSSTKNKIIAIGCDTTIFSYLNSNEISSGCDTSCAKAEDVIFEPCSGIGCCEMPVPNAMKIFSASVNSYWNHRKVWSFDPCSAAFLGEEGVHKLKMSDFSSTTSLEDIPVVLNFGVGNKTCKAAEKDSTTYLCKENSYCYEAVDGEGYLCSCKIGYDGNPYLQHSCQDVNECEDPTKNSCDIGGICSNTPGSHYCTCPPDSYGDGRKDGSRCTKRNKAFPIIGVTLGTGLGSLILLIGGSCLYIGVKKRRLSKLKEQFFKQNGGLLLRQQISSHQGGAESTQIFTAEELKLATNNYDERRILGQGGNGTVYKGVLTDLRNVAIKKSKRIDESQLGQFINEVVILTQINHRNVVKLLGCCLETEVPVLVYECVSRGTLYDHLHKAGTRTSSFSCEDRIRIAAEIAGAIAYLHSAASIPIIHRDIKSANILLDDHYTAKIADFGASRMNPFDQTQISTLVQGTMGYLDPEYFHNSQLTEKSDVYSFGVVLAELLTGKKALCFERSQEQRNLASYFNVTVEERRFFTDVENKEQVYAAAELAKRCMNLKGEKRPSMIEVATELESLRSSSSLPLTHQSNEERMNFSHTEGDLYAIPLISHSTNGESRKYSLQSDVFSIVYPR